MDVLEAEKKQLEQQLEHDRSEREKELSETVEKLQNQFYIQFSLRIHHFYAHFLGFSSYKRN